MAGEGDHLGRDVQPEEAGGAGKKLIQFARWQKQGGAKGTCDHCKAIHEQFIRDGIIPPGTPFRRCADCPATALHPDNVQVWELYSRCWNQVVTAGMGDVIGISLPAVYMVMRSMGIPEEEHLSVIDRIILLHDVFFPVKKAAEKENGHRTDTPASADRRTADFVRLDPADSHG